jgi:hypothetical protein
LNVVSRDLLLLEQERRRPIEKKTEIYAKGKIHAKGAALLGAGLVSMGIGVYLLIASGVIGLFFILAGLIFAVSAVDIDGGWFGFADMPLKERERRAKDRWDKDRLNQEREVKE